MRHQDYQDDIQEQCRFCEHAKILPSGTQVLCPYRGILGIANSCRRFRYDLLKRTPSKMRRVFLPDDAELAWEDEAE